MKALLGLVAVILIIALVFPVTVGLAVILIGALPIVNIFMQLYDLIWVKSHLEDSLVQFDHFRLAYNKALAKCQELSLHSDDGDLPPQHGIILRELKSVATTVLEQLEGKPSLY